MSIETGIGDETPTGNGVQRYKRILGAALLAFGISFAMAVPTITGWTVLEARFGGGQLCSYYDTSAPGIWIQDPYESKIKCKIMYHRVLTYWAFSAAPFLPLGSIITVARYLMRRNAIRKGPSSELHRTIRRAEILGGALLFLYMTGMTLHKLLT